MTKRLYIYAAWCLFIIMGTTASSFFAWMPFSDEDDGGGTTMRGPSHK